MPAYVTRPAYACVYAAADGRVFEDCNSIGAEVDHNST